MNVEPGSPFCGKPGFLDASEVHKAGGASSGSGSFGGNEMKTVDQMQEISQSNLQNHAAVVQGGVGQGRIYRLINLIDIFTEWVGKVVSWGILPMVGSLVFEIVSRYLFSAPTIWAEDVSTMLYGAFFMLGASYALRKGKHIRTDFFYEKWPPRVQGLVDGIIYVLIFLPSIGFWTVVTWDFAYTSVLLNERSISSPWMPYVWPLKLAMPLTGFLLFIQGISETLKSFLAAVKGVTFGEEAEKVEI